VLKSQSDDEIINVKKNTTFGEGRWRVINITPQKIDIEDTKIKLDAPHTIFFTGENG
jgi:hypothetical protein